MRQFFKRLIQRLFKRPIKRLFKSKPNRSKRTSSPTQASLRISSSPSVDPEREPTPTHIPAPTPTPTPQPPPPFDSNDSENHPPASHDRLKTLGNAALVGLNVIKETIDGIPILESLKGPIQGFLEVVDVIKTKSDVDDELKELDARVTKLSSQIFDPLRGKQAVEIPADLTQRLVDFGSGIGKIVKEAQAIKDQGAVSAGVNARENAEIISGFKSKISELLEHFNLDHQISNVLKMHRDGLKRNVERLPHVYAAYNSTQDSSAAKQTRRRTCLPSTAEKILKELNEWIDSDSGPNVLMIHGLAGVGKSTIAQTIAESRASRGPSDSQNTKPTLGASFFFIRNVNDNPDTFFPTIAFQLADRFPDSYMPHLGQYLDPILDVKTKPLKEQFEEMIIKPLSQISHSDASRALILIDAFDECTAVGADTIIKLLTSRTFNTRTKILITCRLDAHLRDALGLAEDASEGVFGQLKLVDMMPLINRDDIGKYIRWELSENSITQKFKNIKWTANESNYQDLETAAGDLFIMASTMVDFIRDGNIRHPMRQLEKLLAVLRKDRSVGSYPYAKLDRIYHTVLQSSYAEWDDVLTERYQAVVGTIIFLQEPLSVGDLTALTSCDEADVEGAIRTLTSVIKRDNALQAPQVYHTSFTDFLTDKTRCERNESDRFFIDEDAHQARIAESCLQIMEDLIKPNILKLSEDESRKNRDEIDDIDTRVKSNISPQLLYACRYWAIHLSRTKQRDNTLLKMLEGFTSKNLLPWMEVLGWEGELANAHAALELVIVWTAGNPSTSLLFNIFHDAQRFLLSSYFFIKNSPTHMYSSALPFAPSESLIFTTYYEKFKTKTLMPIRILNGQPVRWSIQSIVLLGHMDAVRQVVFSPDGKRLASASKDKTVRLWDGVTGELVAELRGHESWVSCIMFSSDGKRLASASDDETVRLWDGVTGELVAELRGHEYSVRSIAFSSDGKRLASASDDETVRLWDGVTGELVAELRGHEDSVLSIVFSSDGKRVASTSSDKTVRLWDGITGELVAELRGPEYSVLSIVFSSDGKRLASRSDDKTIRLWDGVTGELVAELRGHEDSVLSIDFSSDGKRLASASDDETVRLWDGVTGELVADLRGHESWVSSIVFSSDGKRLASASNDETVRLWDGVTGVHVAELRGHKYSVRSIVFSSDGKRLASASDDETIRLWDGVTGEHVAELQGHEDSVLSIDFSSDGKRLASASDDKTVRLWDGVTGELAAEPQGCESSVWSIDFSSGGKRLASRSDNKTIQLWDGVTGEHVAELRGHESAVSSFVFSSDGKRLASASQDETVRLWDGVTGEHVADLRGHEAWVSSIVFSSDGKRLASTSDDKTVQLWDGVTGVHVAELRGHKYSVRSMVFSSDGKRLASASYDKTVRLWDGVTGELVAELRGHIHWIRSIAFSSDGKRLASASSDKTVQLWDGVTGEHVADLRGHKAWVSSIVFTSDGKRLASASDDKTVRLWDGVTGEHVAELRGHESSVWSMVFSSDGKRLASASDDKTVRLWDGVTGELVAELRGHEDSVWFIVFLSDGRRLASASSDRTVRLWDGISGAFIAHFPCDPASLDAFSHTLFSSSTLMLSLPTSNGLQYVFSFREDSHSAEVPLLWIPAWMEVQHWWPLPLGRLFIASKNGQIYILAPNDS